MRRIYTLLVLVLTMSFATSCLDTRDDAQGIKLVTADEMQAILELEDVQLVDVRSSEAFDAMHIVNAQNIDFSSPTFEEDISKLDKEKPVLLYCNGGNKSARCAQKLEEAGFKKIYDLDGGISKWRHSKKIKIEIKS